MQVTTKAIVISALKYGDTGLIAKCYTYEEGIKTYLLQGILKKKKGKLNKSQFLPLTILQIQASHNSKGSLNRISEARVLQPYLTLHVDVLKQSLVFFLSEFLSQILAEEEEHNSILFEFLEQTLIWLDHHDEVANFHLKFLMELTKCLGFYPDESNQERNWYFDLSEGKYTPSQGVSVIYGEDLLLFNKALGIKFDELNKTRFSKHQRTTVLDMILRYYQFHMSNFRMPKSLAVLSKVLE